MIGVLGMCMFSCALSLLSWKTRFENQPCIGLVQPRLVAVSQTDVPTCHKVAKYKSMYKVYRLLFVYTPHINKVEIGHSNKHLYAVDITSSPF